MPLLALAPPERIRDVARRVPGPGESGQSAGPIGRILLSCVLAVPGLGRLQSGIAGLLTVGTGVPG